MIVRGFDHCNILIIKISKQSSSAEAILSLIRWLRSSRPLHTTPQFNMFAAGDEFEAAFEPRAAVHFKLIDNVRIVILSILFGYEESIIEPQKSVRQLQPDASSSSSVSPRSRCTRTECSNS